MATRRQKTAIDYIIIALNPVLIVAMIASLVYFLTLCFYRGELLARMNYILMLFVVACVGIARIAIEEGRARAIGFAAALGGATLISVSRFVGDGLPMTVALLALIWYLADRITIDCTVIDEKDDASGEGLLQGGLFGDKKTQPSIDVSLDGTTHASTDTFTKDQVNEDAADSKKLRTKKATHRPGMWVMYLAFGAIPLYGLGQVLLPSRADYQSSALTSLGIYLASSLLLLVSTSFLGLRRYLRQRGVDMPAAVSVNWLGFGAAVVAGLLLVCFTLPLPGKLLGEVELPSYVENREGLQASKYGWGNEGVDSKRKDVPGASKGEEPTNEQQPGGSGGKGKKQSGGDKGKRGQAGDSNEKDANKKGSGGKGQEKSSGKGKGQSNRKGDAPPDKRSDQKGSESKSDQGDRGNKQQTEENKSGASEKQSDNQSNNQKKRSDQNGSNQQQDERSQTNDQKNGERGDQGDPSEEEGSPSDSPPPSNDSNFQMPQLPNLSGLFRFLILMVLGGIVAFYVFRHWDEILSWIRELFGMWNTPEVTKSQSEPEVAQTQITRRSFASFNNPLDDPNQTLEDAVVQTFGALCAWAREHGYERSEDTAPAEFGRELGKHFPLQKISLASVCDLYGVVAYGNRRVNPEHRTTLESIWRFMLSPPVQSLEPEKLTSEAISVANEPKQRWKE